ncbi:hypothetical protein [Chelativorans sp. M5D2P16]|uniref:hypothetical protein n=1 Tax=Chelativorans sp. M5D2P16 TaxID=3095678 RepID=UPI002ACA4BBB|nr:hypothetical protein [Chelativorans sp. M5D2P16]MDZ5699065.1 hypothetical protein [Chelativorans sp. M5D2P16]
MGHSLSTVAALVSLCAWPALAGSMDSPVMRFDVAEDHTRFAFSDGRVHEDGMPAYGNRFVTRGYIYPAGTLDDADGVKENGDPAFPDKVLGTWTCDGWFVADGAHTEQGVWLISRQVYDSTTAAACWFPRARNMPMSASPTGVRSRARPATTRKFPGRSARPSWASTPMAG